MLLEYHPRTGDPGLEFHPFGLAGLHRGREGKFQELLTSSFDNPKRQRFALAGIFVSLF